MAKKRNDIEVEDITSTSQYDGLQVLKDAHSLPGHYIRTKESLTLVRTYFDSFTIQSDSNNNPTEVCYFAGTKAHLTEMGMVDDVSSSLASTYFIIGGGRKDARYVVYFKVNGVGVSPGLDGTIDVEVNINEDDAASVIALAVQLALFNLGKVFHIDRKNTVLEITPLKLGEGYDTLDVGTGFTISNTAGESTKVQTVNLTYSADGYPIWQSQELVGYVYNVYTGRFEIDSSTDSISQNLSPLSDVDAETIDVTTTPTLIATAGSNKTGRREVTFQPKGKTIWYWYDNTVSSGNSGNSFKVTSNTFVTEELSEDQDIYAVTSSGTAKVAVSEGK